MMAICICIFLSIRDYHLFLSRMCTCAGLTGLETGLGITSQQYSTYTLHIILFYYYYCCCCLHFYESLFVVFSTYVFLFSLLIVSIMSYLKYTYKDCVLFGCEYSILFTYRFVSDLFLLANDLGCYVNGNTQQIR